MTREEQDKRIAELYEWTTHDLALYITELETALKPFADATYNDNGDVTVGWPAIHDFMRAKSVLEDGNCKSEHAQRRI